MNNKSHLSDKDNKKEQKSHKETEINNGVKKGKPIVETAPVLFTDEEIEEEQRIFLRGMENNDPSDNVGDCIMIEANERHSKIIEGIIKKLEEFGLWEYNDLDTRINKINELTKRLHSEQTKPFEEPLHSADVDGQNISLIDEEKDKTAPIQNSKEINCHICNKELPENIHEIVPKK